MEPYTSQLQGIMQAAQKRGLRTSAEQLFSYQIADVGRR
jgi:hypothetical protein